MLKTRIFALALIPVVILGFFIIPIVPILLEFANEVCFPVGEAVTSGFLYSIAHVLGFFLGTLFSLIVDSFKDKETGTFWCIVAFAFVYLITLVSVFFMK
jgi:FLVCR family feline leukemia virus subgroup C receptor-related protein